jgi:hypothetical protein
MDLLQNLLMRNIARSAGLLCGNAEKTSPAGHVINMQEGATGAVTLRRLKGGKLLNYSGSVLTVALK